MKQFKPICYYLCMNVQGRKLFVFNSFISIAGSLVAGGFNYIFHFLVSRRLTVPQYGELQALISLVGVLAIFGSTFSNATIRTIASYAAQNKFGDMKKFILSARKHAYVGALWMLAALLALSYVFIHALHLESFWELLFVYGTVITGLIAAVDNGVLTGLENFRIVNVTGVLNAAVKFFTGVALAYFFAKTSYVAFSFFLSGVTGLVIYRIFANRVMPVQTAGQELAEGTWYKLEKSLIQVMFPVFIFSFLLVLANNLDVLLVKGFAGSQVVGFYGAFETLGNIIFFVNSAIIAVILPRASGEGYQGKPINYATLLLTYFLVIVVGASGIILFIFFPHAIINTLYGAKYLVSISNLWIFGLLALVMSFFLLEANIAYARHDYVISYVQAIVCAGIITAVATHHGSVHQIVIGVMCAFALGWILALIRHILVRKRYVSVAKPLTVDPLF